MELTREVLDLEFPSRLHGIQFNHAAVCPLPARGRDAMSAHAENLATRGSLDWRDWDAAADRVRTLAARLVGADERVGGASSISIVPNTSLGLNFVAQGLDWNPGDSIVTSDDEFPSNLAPWLGLVRRGVVVRRIPTRDGAFTAADVEAACDGTTRLVSLSAVAFHTGFVAPMAEVGAFCRSRGILFGLDGIQAVGAVPVDVVASRVDFLSADGHKWMLGPEGAGILFTTPELRVRLTPPGGWLNIRRDGHTFKVPETLAYLEDGRRFEPGARATAGIYALGASLSLLLEIGAKTISRRIRATQQVLVNALPELGFAPILFGGPPRSGILAARPPEGKAAHFFAKRMEDDGIVVGARMGFLRFSPHVGNDEEEARRVIQSISRLV